MKVRKLGILALGLSLMLSFSACNSNETTTTTTTTYNGPELIIDENYNASEIKQLGTLQVDLTNVKTEYYEGEEFTSEGLVVKAVFNYLNDVGQTIKSETEVITDYFLDTSAIDMSTAGVYTVRISYRIGESIRSTSYTIQVKNPVLETTEGVTYAAGLEIGYVSSYSTDKFNKDLLLDSDFDFVNGNLTYTLHQYTIENGKKVESTKLIRSSSSTLNVDTSAVDMSKVGTYMIKVTYTGDPIVIDGKTYENKATSCVMFNVINPVVSVEKYSTGDTDIPASVDLLDLSNWKFKITRKVREPEIVNYDPELFSLSGVCNFFVGQQEAKIVFKEATEFGLFPELTIPVNVVESIDYNIIVGNQLVNGMVTFEKEDGSIGYTETSSELERQAVDNSGIFYATNIARKANTYAIDNLTLLGRIKLNNASKDADGNVTVEAGKFEIIMDKPGKVIFYASSTGSTARDITVACPDGMDNYEFNVTLNNSPERCEFEATQAGTYVITGQIYIFGCVVAMGK